MIITIKAKPSSKKEEIFILGKNNFEVHLKERAEKNKANIELIKLLARHFNVSSSNIKVLKGINSKNKVVEISKDEN